MDGQGVVESLILLGADCSVRDTRLGRIVLVYGSTSQGGGIRSRNVKIVQIWCGGCNRGRELSRATTHKKVSNGKRRGHDKDKEDGCEGKQKGGRYGVGAAYTLAGS